MGKKIRCDVYGDDWVKAKGEEGNNYVELDVSLGETRDHLFLTPSDARKLRKQIKKALEAIEGDGGEAEGPVIKSDNSKPKVGDKIRILVNGADLADVKRGDEFFIAFVEKDGGVEVSGAVNWRFSPKNFEVISGAASDFTPA